MTETPQHTPGPWTLEPNGTAYNLRSPDRVDHFLILIGMVHNNPGEFPANARLIAAAPELLQLLKELLPVLQAVHENEYGDDPEMQPILANRIRAAIAKATGGK